ncbi:MAG: 6-hydroxycyclohex-1-ene-1-carbonyl-CoA dehydrogenase [Deltaproteobacteria bacterium]|nr:6-hydroxycyclohex-1-ene-1-carbonyl-CoA dehydrogenase [Deltaproteobacteria bacterium]
MGVNTRAGWRMVAPGRLEHFEEPLEAPPPGWTTVEVLGCGVCHTDIGYLYEGVPTAWKGPIVLGHEVVGRLVSTGALVVVPSVSPCGDCRSCLRGRPTACRASKMPGNHHDGGFATHVNVPARWLCPVPALPDGVEPWQLSVVADALTTPWQALQRARVAAGDVCVVVGVGGVGGFLAELARSLGAHPVALDVDPTRLARMEALGVPLALDTRDRDPKALRKELAGALSARGLDPDGWHVFECSGSPAGQRLAFGLLNRGATLSVVGFTPEPSPFTLSNLMALDAEAYGNWGCDPGLYPDVVARVLAGAVDLPGAVARFPLSDAPAVLSAVHRRELGRRAVLVPHA